MSNIQERDPQEVLEAVRVKFDGLLSGLDAGDLGDRARMAMKDRLELGGQLRAGDSH